MEGMPWDTMVQGGALLAFLWVTYNKLDKLDNTLSRMLERQRVINMNLKALLSCHPEEVDSLPDDED